ncbi:uncharacterized protein LOC105695406 [Orussus abietinus]|uniref:uncharacterized protein LOC105695406 n=1 Tax=Orussus abietinus TaxID=222816 RepID=UPI0006256D93|nr:uncharacterized protein LOC105695406 [Orussus abietinus]
MMPEIHRSDSLRSTLEAGRERRMPAEISAAAAPAGKTPERSVSFNRDVHVKRIGRGTPRVTAALVGDGEGRLIATPVHKESITSRSKEDLAQEAALVLQQAGSLRCIVQDEKSLPGRFSTLPARKEKKRPDLPLKVPRRRSEEIGVTTDELVGLPRPKKKALERSVSDATPKKLKGPLSRLFSPKSERKAKPVSRSASDASRPQRKRSGSESEGSHLGGVRAKKQLSPIIEASPRVDEAGQQKQPFDFGANEPGTTLVSQRVEERSESVLEEVCATRSPRSQKKSPSHQEVETEGGKDREGEETRQKGAASPARPDVDEVDRVGGDMLHSSRFDRRAEESTIHKMIHRLSTDRSPPPQLTRTMVSPSPGFGHNNNRPFSYTQPNESTSPHPQPQTGVIYAQVQLGKKKAQRSHSDSDEGLGLERKDSSRENSPAEKDYRRTDFAYGTELRRNNEINSFKSRYDQDRKNVTHFGDFCGTKEFPPNRTVDPKRMHEFETIDRHLFEKPEKYTSTVFVDASSRGKVDGVDAAGRPGERGVSNKTSELSARRDLLESRIKSRLLADEMFAAKSNGTTGLPKKVEHEIIDKPIVPSPVIPNRVSSPKRYTDTYITETRTNSNGEKYIFEKEIHEDNGKVYGFEKKITNKIPADTYIDPKPRDGYTVETRTDKYGDKYLVETRTHQSYTDDFKPFLSDRSRTSPEERFQSRGKTSYHMEEAPARSRIETKDLREASPIVAKKIYEHKFSRSEDFLDRESKPPREPHFPKTKKNFESIRGMSKSTQRLDEIGENSRVRALRSEYVSRSHENLSSADYANIGDLHLPAGSSSPISPKQRPHRLEDNPRDQPIDDYDTDISQMTNSQLESNYFKETRTTQRYSTSKRALHDDYDSSPPRLKSDRPGYGSSRYDSDTTARDSIRREARYQDDPSRVRKNLHAPAEEDPKKPLRRSRNHLDYFDDSDARDSPRGNSTKSRLETFDESPAGTPRVYHHESKIRHTRHETRGYTERRHRETRLSDPDRKDRLADSGIENDYRRDSQEADRRENLESEDEGFVTMRFIKHERRHTDRNMSSPGEKRKYDKYATNSGKPAPLTSKPPTGLMAGDKKYEKKAAKKSGTMSKVKQLFSKKEKKVKEEKSKRGRPGSNGALTDDEVTMRYREYRGDQLRSAKSARDLDSDINRDDYSQRRRLSTPSGSPSPPRPARLSRSTGTLTRDEDHFCGSKSTLTRENQGQEAERKGWFKSLSRKNKTNAKAVDKKPRIPESEILTTGTEDEEVSSTPERVSVQKNLRFFGDTDQESVSSNRDRKSKRAEDHVDARRDATNSSRHPLGLVAPPRKPRLAESALSSGESTTGDSSQQSQNSQRSQRSVVYLHAPTVGDIPGPNERRRAASREELNRPLQAFTRTVSRSVSVLAPWKPRHYREPFEINYDQQQQHHHQKPVSTMRRKQRSRETLNRRGKEARRSKDNLAKTGTISRSTLKSQEKQKVDRTMSTESLANKSRTSGSRPELGRSTSVPRDPNKGAGWFKLKSGKKSRA